MGVGPKVYTITLTDRQAKELEWRRKWSWAREYYERLADTTEHPREWLLERLKISFALSHSPVRQSEVDDTIQRTLREPARNGQDVLVFVRAESQKDSGVFTEMESLQ